MKLLNNIGYMALLLMILATPALAIFVGRIEPDREEATAEFVLVKGGCFQMGSNEGRDTEKPVHEVCVDDFSLGKTEVTVGQFRKFVDATGYRTEAEQGDGCYVWNGSIWRKDRRYSWRNLGFIQKDSHPVACVSWNDAKAFIDWSANKSGKVVRFPTEAEWEYAARSGGKEEQYAGGDKVDAVAWYNSNSGNNTHPVGLKEANGLGLYDMSGNVWEWTGDWYGARYYEESQKNNPRGPSEGYDRVSRGGCWNSEAKFLRTTDHGGRPPDSRYNILGFRLAIGR